MFDRIWSLAIPPDHPLAKTNQWDIGVTYRSDKNISVPVPSCGYRPFGHTHLSKSHKWTPARPASPCKTEHSPSMNWLVLYPKTFGSISVKMFVNVKSLPAWMSELGLTLIQREGTTWGCETRVSYVMSTTTSRSTPLATVVSVNTATTPAQDEAGRFLSRVRALVAS